MESESAFHIDERIHKEAPKVYTELSGWIEDVNRKRRNVEVEIAGDGTVVDASCSCKAAAPCKHIGAVLLVHADEEYQKDSEVKSAKSRAKETPATIGPSTEDALLEESSEESSSLDFLEEYSLHSDYELRLDFVPMEVEGAKVIFGPVFRFSSPSPASKAYRDVIVSEGSEDSVYDFRSDAARSVWTDVELSEEEAELLAKSRFDIEDINRVRELVQRRGTHPRPVIRIDFPFHTYTLREERAVPRVDITEYKEGISLKLAFIIENTPEPFDLEDGFYRRGVESTLSLVYVPESYRRSCWEELRRRLGSQVVREEPSGTRYHFTVKISASDFILDNAAEFIEKGWEIRTRGARLRSYRAKDFSVRTYLSRNNWLEVEVGEMDDGGFEPFDFSPSELESGILSRGEEFIYVDRKVLEKLRRLRLFGTEGRGRFTISPYNSCFWREFSSSLYYGEQEKSAEGSEAKRHLELLRDALSQLEDFSSLGEERSAVEPEGFQGSLRDYQKTGLAWLLFLRDRRLAGCLADDMGLGKTVQTLALLQHSKNEGPNGRALIVAPVSTLPNWHSEIEQFTPGLSVYRYHGQERDADKLDVHDIVLTSYATLRNDIEVFLDHEFSYLILDEAQAIKNAASKTFKAVKMLSVPHRLTLTGTPLENNLLELWAQMDFLLPGLLGTRNAFTERFVKDIEQNRGEEKVSLLRSTIYPFLLRRTKGAVAPDLPDKEEITVYAEMEEQQAAFYHGVRTHYRKKVDSEIHRVGVGKSSTTIFEALLRVRQAAIFPSLLGAEHQNIPSCKFDLLKETLEDIIGEGYKTVIFSQFLGSLERIRRWAGEEGHRYAYLDGSIQNREEQISSFQQDPELRLFLISLKAGGLGINLTAADYVILFDPWWNPAVERQAIDRVHRIGQTSKIIAYRYIVKDSIEEKILALQESKRELAEEIITEEGSLVKSLSREDIEYLFS